MSYDLLAARLAAMTLPQLAAHYLSMAGCARRARKPGTAYHHACDLCREEFARRGPEGLAAQRAAEAEFRARLARGEVP